MLKLDRIGIFLEVAANQSFAKAARHLGMTGPAVSKQIMSLESELGVKLLNRTTRLVTLTEEGSAFYDRARTAMDELREAVMHTQDSKASPSGPLRISAPLSFGQLHLLPVLSGFALKYPDIRLDVLLEDRMVDVVAERFDIVLRIGVPQDSTLISRHLADCPILLVASPDYVATHGNPGTPDDLQHHRLIAYTHQGGQSEWRYLRPDGTVGAHRFEGHFRANTSDMMTEAALAGIGIAQLPQFSVAVALKSGRLIQLLPDYPTTPMRQLSALTPPNRYRSAKVRLFLDWLGEACKSMEL